MTVSFFVILAFVFSEQFFDGVFSLVGYAFSYVDEADAAITERILSGV